MPIKWVKKPSENLKWIFFYVCKGTSMYYVSTKGGGGGSAKCLLLLTWGEGGGQGPCLRNHILQFFFALRAKRLHINMNFSEAFQLKIAQFWFLTVYMTLTLVYIVGPSRIWIDFKRCLLSTWRFHEYWH